MKINKGLVVVSSEGWMINCFYYFSYFRCLGQSLTFSLTSTPRISLIYFCGQWFCLFSRFGVCVPPDVPWATQTPSIFTTLPMRTQAARWNVGRANDPHLMTRLPEEAEQWHRVWVTSRLAFYPRLPPDRIYIALITCRQMLQMTYSAEKWFNTVILWCNRTGLFMIIIQTANDTQNCCASLSDP